MQEMISGEHPFEQVRKFMLAGEQCIDGTSSSQIELYLNLIKEESAEFWNGLRNQDDIETLDGICDMIVVLVGYAHSRGWNIIGAFEEVARSNMSKVDRASGKILKRADGKVQKPDTYSPPNLAPYIRKPVDMPAYEHIRMGE